MAKIEKIAIRRLTFKNGICIVVAGWGKGFPEGVVSHDHVEFLSRRYWESNYEFHLRVKQRVNELQMWFDCEGITPRLYGPHPDELTVEEMEEYRGMLEERMASVQYKGEAYWLLWKAVRTARGYCNALSPPTESQWSDGHNYRWSDLDVKRTLQQIYEYVKDAKKCT